MQDVNKVQLAGGDAGWGGLVNKGDLIIPPNCATDCLNVFEQDGKLKKRQGYTVDTGIYMLAGSVATDSGSYDATLRTIAQNVKTTGTGTGGSISYSGGAGQTLIVGFCVDFTTPGNVIFTNFSLYTNVAGAPGVLIAAKPTTVGVGGQPLDGKVWLYSLFQNITVGSDFFIVLNGGSGTLNYCYSSSYGAGGKLLVDDGAGYSEVSGKFLNFKVWFLDTTATYKFENIDKYKQKTSCSFSGTLAIPNGTNQMFSAITSGSGSISSIKNEGIMIIEDQTQVYNVLFYPKSSGEYGLIFPAYINSSGSSQVKNFAYFSSTDYLIIAMHDDTSTHLLVSDTSGFTKNIGTYAGKSRVHCAYNEDIVAIALEPTTYSAGTYTPLSWGSTPNGFSDFPQIFTFTGLTNAITQAITVMYHGNRFWWGNVIVNSVNYPTRLYYSGIATPQAGYSDTGYIELDSSIVATLDVGDYAILADKTSTYTLLGGSGVSTGFERFKHDLNGGVQSKDSICVYKDSTGYCKVYGISNIGIFEIDKTSKKFIHENIKNKIKDDFPVLTYCYPDYEREMVVFSYMHNAVRYAIGYSVKNGTWWPEDNKPESVVTAQIGSFYPRVYGVKTNELWTLNDTNMDNGNFIHAYCKLGPAYANSDGVFSPTQTWLKHRNEPIMSHLDVKFTNDYGTENVVTKQVRRPLQPNNVPILQKADMFGSGSSIEIELHQDAISTTINTDSNSGQAVLNVASVTGFIVGHKIIINDGGVREEERVISAIGTTSLTVTANLTNTHTAVQADTVKTYDESFCVSDLKLDFVPHAIVDQTFNEI
jgi:hypothetical protein